MGEGKAQIEPHHLVQESLHTSRAIKGVDSEGSWMAPTIDLYRYTLIFERMQAYNE